MDVARKNLEIHDTTIILSSSFQLNKVTCILENETTNEKYFYFFGTSEKWRITRDGNPHDAFKVYVFGHENNSEEITVSGTCIVKTDQPEIQELVLKEHSKTMSILLLYQFLVSSTSDSQDEPLKFKVSQRIQHFTRTPYIVFEQECGALSQHETCVQIVRCENSKDDAEFKEYIRFSTANNNELQCIDLPSRKKVTYKIYQVIRIKEMSKVINTSKTSTFNTHNTMHDVNKLMEKAEHFIAHAGSMPVPYMFRNKPRHHPTITEANVTGIIKKYIKDNNGDQASAINNQIDGLFFSATGDKCPPYHPPSRSPFGDYRIQMPPSLLFGDEYGGETCLYFADFYCKHSSSLHYVTLVLTKCGSIEDDFCKDRLPKLDIHHNKFLFRSYGEFCTPNYRYLNVEVLYTENINLTEMRKKIGFQEKYVLSSGQSTGNGIPKTINCSTCNL